ncbi:DUF4241 domain-containing protein [Streptomyces spiramenti]|uniref:DUF4241 domain-containing protein n=1 Tax=Streptomyces spiramenti TaxID=2720606 RepID=A0ABX1APQ9_9ACTN|nr:DUF4241 domain-containing protein [Streptomyces spiramenti]NJP66663.1 DUF4241 domain-containing protein [Streptomyces spiramenti]
MARQPCDLEYLCAFGARLGLHSGRTAVVRRLDVGALPLPSGRLVAGDPADRRAAPEPFVQRVSSGPHAVVLHLAELAAVGQLPAVTLVAAARLVIRETPVSSWEPALCEGEDPDDLAEDDFFGHAARNGVGGFADAGHSPTGDGTRSPTARAPGAPAPWPHGTHAVLPGTGPTPPAVVFRTGHGDGDYPTWLGRGADGEAVCFLSDFFVLTDGEVLERLDSP